MPSTREVRGRLVAIALAATMAVGIGAVVVTPSARAADAQTDPAGDAGAGPDVVSVEVSTAGERLAVAVRFANEPPLDWSEAEGFTDSLMIFVATGSVAPPSVEDAGDMYVFGAHGTNVNEPPPFNHIVGGRSGEIEFGIATADASGDTITMSVPLTALGNPDDIHVLVTAGREGGADASAGDAFPDEGWASYTVSALGPTEAAGFDRQGAVLAVVLVGVALVAAVAILGRRSPAARRAVHNT